jgi:hypothetical protein
MARNLEKRIADLERLCSADSGNPEEGSLGRREAMSASLRRAEEKAATEEAAQGDLRRRHALDSLFKFLFGDEPHGG